MRVCGEWCGLRRRGFGAVKERVLSLGADSLCASVLWIWVEVREWFFTNSLKSMGYLRTDRASFCVALGSKRDCTAVVWRLVRHLLDKMNAAQSTDEQGKRHFRMP